MNKRFRGQVVNSNGKTAKISVTSIYRHKGYNKELKKVKMYLVHDEIGSSIGDVVEIVETKPISKLKKFKINKIIEKNDSEV
jgi:small subunit ribosomal protein S17